MSRMRLSSPLFWLPAGFLVWSACFVALYALHALGCAWGWNRMALGAAPLDRTVLVGAWLVHLALACGLGGLALAQWTQSRRGAASRFNALAALGVTGAAIAATVAIGMPVVFLKTCAGG